MFKTEIIWNELKSNYEFQCGLCALFIYGIKRLCFSFGQWMSQLAACIDCSIYVDKARNHIAKLLRIVRRCTYSIPHMNLIIPLDLEQFPNSYEN